MAQAKLFYEEAQHQDIAGSSNNPCNPLPNTYFIQVSMLHLHSAGVQASA